MIYSTKKYGHDIGLSACFRQWKAKSHCNLLHGYSLAFTLKFACETPDGRDWVVDFGALKPVKQWLEYMFDHNTLIAQDDPGLPTFVTMAGLGLLRVLEVPKVGCEAFATMVYGHVDDWLRDYYLPSLDKIGVTPPVGLRLYSVEVAEHGANSATFSAC